MNHSKILNPLDVAGYRIVAPELASSHESLRDELRRSQLDCKTYEGLAREAHAKLDALRTDKAPPITTNEALQQLFDAAHARLIGPSRASAECPICGMNTPHPHDRGAVEAWATNQVARWGYAARIGTPPNTWPPDLIDVVRRIVKQGHLLKGDLHDLYVSLSTIAHRPDSATVTPAASREPE